MPVGQKLEEARKRKGVSLREVSESTKIRGDYLSAIESGNYEINLPEVYLRGFVRLYAKFLGLDQDAMVASLIMILENQVASCQKNLWDQLLHKIKMRIQARLLPKKVPHPRPSTPQHQVSCFHYLVSFLWWEW